MSKAFGRGILTPLKRQAFCIFDPRRRSAYQPSFAQRAFCLETFFGAAMAEATNRRGYVLAVSAGLNAAFAAISAKLFSSLVIRYGLVILFNMTMWGCYVNSLKTLSSLQATVTNFASNFLCSGLAGLFFFDEALSFQWFAGALFIVIGVLVLNKSSAGGKTNID